MKLGNRHSRLPARTAQPLPLLVAPQVLRCQLLLGPDLDPAQEQGALAGQAGHGLAHGLVLARPGLDPEPEDLDPELAQGQELAGRDRVLGGPGLVQADRGPGRGQGPEVLARAQGRAPVPGVPGQGPERDQEHARVRVPPERSPRRPHRSPSPPTSCSRSTG